MTTPAVPAPDEKDWTWVLAERCPECGFDATAITLADLPGLVSQTVATFEARLADDDATVRPSPQTWSPTEYACHIQDVCRTFTERLDLMRTYEDPPFENWDQDATALERRYWEQAPADVLAPLRESATAVGAAFAAVPEPERSRTGRRSNGSAFTIDTLGRYFVHDLVHHAWDVTHAR